MNFDCIFCGIASGDADASVVVSDEHVVAFMDLRAFHPGHTLVIPKRHITDVMALENVVIAGALMSTVARIARAVQAVFAADGISVWQSNGKAAGQEVLHLHTHVVPRYEGDGLLRVYPSKPDYPERADLDEHARRIRDALDAPPSR
jgi:histidine triad (HIT) family protein